MSLNRDLHLDCAKACLSVYEYWPDVSGIESNGMRILAISGTRDFADWLTNISFFANDDYCHRGFLARAYRLLPECLETLRGDRSIPIVLTGHSLGGAVAMLLAAKLKLLGYPVPACVTFGQPMVGDRKFATLWQSLEIATTRYVHGSDPVPRTPGLNFGFCHVPSDLILLPDPRPRWFDWIEDHDMALYLEGLELLSLPAAP
jgi:pimeloyl-ACP methyl ester carboxylesterase